MTTHANDWLEAAASELAERAARDTAALVAVSSPSGDVEGAEAAVAAAVALLPPGASVERIPCSSPDHAPDLVATLSGTGARRVLLLGHLDTVVSHSAHRPLTVDGGRLSGSGAVDMKGGVALALGAMRALAGHDDRFAELVLLLVLDEEWRQEDFAHVQRFAGFDGCLCFEAGERTSDGNEAVVVRRKAAGTLHVRAHGRAAHSGAAPDKGANALLALAAVAQGISALHDPAGPRRLTAVPTILRSGDAFNVVPAAGELYGDLRADTLEAFDSVLADLPAVLGEVTLEAELVRRWPGMDSRAATRELLAQAGELSGAPIVAAERGGASDASHFARSIALTVDGLGPRGGGAHTPREYVAADSLRPRARVALALALAALAVD